MSDGVKRVPVAEYPYRDRDGNLVAVKVRLEPGFDGRPKDFVWRRPVPPRMARFFELDPAKPAWVNSLKDGWYGLHRTDPDGTSWFGPEHGRTDRKSFELPEVEPRVYRLPELLAADPRQPVFLVESEKNVDMLRSIGFVAACGHAGSGPWDDHLGNYFSGRRVVLVPDQDFGEKGLKWSLKAHASLCYYAAASTRFLVVPGGPKKKGDPPVGIEDWLCKAFSVPKTVNPVLPAAAALAEVVRLIKDPPTGGGESTNEDGEHMVGRLWDRSPTEAA